jgi:hypothetical protein
LGLVLFTATLLFSVALVLIGALVFANDPAVFNAVGGGIVAVGKLEDSGIEDNGGISSSFSTAVGAGAVFSTTVVCSVVCSELQASSPINIKLAAKSILF